MSTFNEFGEVIPADKKPIENYMKAKDSLNGEKCTMCDGTGIQIIRPEPRLVEVACGKCRGSGLKRYWR